jgi:hypothetical protein
MHTSFSWFYSFHKNISTAFVRRLLFQRPADCTIDARTADSPLSLIPRSPQGGKDIFPKPLLDIGANFRLKSFASVKSRMANGRNARRYRNGSEA